MTGTGLVAALIAALAAAWLLQRALRACEAANEADWGGRWLNRLDGLNRIFCRRYHRLAGHIDLPETGAALVASNHVSGLDPLLMIAASRRPLRFVIAREEYERWWFTWLFRAIGCIPIDRSRNPHVAFYAARRALAAGEIVALFPQGRIHPDHLPPIPLRRGIVLLAQMTRTPIVPVRIDGVRGQGLGAAALLVRSRARLQQREWQRCERRTPERSLARLAQALAPRACAGRARAEDRT